MNRHERRKLKSKKGGRYRGLKDLLMMVLPMEVKKLMGKMTAISISQSGVDMLKGLEMHLVGNFYPPHTKKFAPLCAKAIEVYNENLYEIEEMRDYSSLKEEYKIPDEVKFRGRDYMTLSEVLESFRLDPWLIITGLEEE